MNQWVDDHWEYVHGKKRRGANDDSGAWIGHVETHTYREKDGLNFQNIIEARCGIRAINRSSIVD